MFRRKILDPAKKAGKQVVVWAAERFLVPAIHVASQPTRRMWR